jgi:hypothetical protein
MNSATELQALTKRLEVVIALLVRGLPKTGEGLSLRGQIEVLSDLGVRPKEIAEILGRTQTYINKELASLRRGKAKNR